MNTDAIKKLKKDKRVLGFMRVYRYYYSVTMVSALATLAYDFYLEGFNNGLDQHRVEDEL